MGLMAVDIADANAIFAEIYIDLILATDAGFGQIGSLAQQVLLVYQLNNDQIVEHCGQIAAVYLALVSIIALRVRFSSWSREEK